MTPFQRKHDRNSRAAAIRALLSTSSPALPTDRAATAHGTAGRRVAMYVLKYAKLANVLASVAPGVEMRVTDIKNLLVHWCHPKQTQTTAYELCIYSRMYQSKMQDHVRRSQQ